MAKPKGNSMYPEMEPGRCAGCGAPALRFKNGIPEDQRHIRTTDWSHAGGTGDCVYVRAPHYVSRRELDGAFTPEPGKEIVQFEIRYFDRSPGNTYRHASGISGYMTVSDEETAKTNADKSSDGHLHSAYVFRMVNGQPEPRSVYAGKAANT